jgi:hypothetical protein
MVNTIFLKFMGTKTELMQNKIKGMENKVK